MSKITKNIFREYDVRGVYGKDLTDELAYWLGRAYGRYLQNEKCQDSDEGMIRGIEGRRLEVVVGRDNRLSGENLRNALVAGLTSAGAKVIDAGLVATPIFYFAIQHYGKKAGVMITASHNPREFNGFKLCKGGFDAIYGAEIQRVYQLAKNAECTPRRGSFGTESLRTRSGREMQNAEWRTANSELRTRDELRDTERRCKSQLPTVNSQLSTNGGIVYKNPVTAYHALLAKKIKLKRRLKVVVDCGNGTGSLFAPRMLRQWGCDVTELYCKSDGSFPNHIADPQDEKAMGRLKKMVKQKKADLGLGFDGDADRLGVVNEKGELISGDQLLILYARELLKKKKGAKIVAEVKCSEGLFEDIKKHGGQPVIWKAGHSLIKAKMKSVKASLGGELSGHFYFKDEYFGFDDALYAAGRILRIVAGSNKKLSELLSDVPKYYATEEYRLFCSDDKKTQVVKKITDYFEKDYEVLAIDGVRVKFADGWALVRASNTQPAISARMEGKSAAARERIRGLVLEKLREWGVK